MKPWKTLKQEVLFENPYIKVLLDNVELPNGVQIDSFCHLHFPTWANVVAFTKEQKIILVKQFRIGIGDFTIEIPAGTVEPGEDPKDAVIRELLEETGYTSTKEPILLKKMHPNPANSDNESYTFILFDCEKTHEQILDIAEDIEVLLVSMEELKELIDMGTISQIFTTTAYYLANEYTKK
ncbi:NUDIX hydrolase [Guggenheimella bovis]